MRVILLSLDAPLVSFGGPAVDQYGVVQRFPALSMLTGLLANALGYAHADVERLEELQSRLRFAARLDRQGQLLRDYQTVDLSTDWMRPENAGWTTRGRVALRGGASSEGTHQRYRHYRADSVSTVALRLVDERTPTTDDVAAALRSPARPLFLGRKCCLPATPLLIDVVERASLMDALRSYPRHPRADAGDLPATWWAGDDDETAQSADLLPVTDERDWRNRVHVGRRLMQVGSVNPLRKSDRE